MIYVIGAPEVSPGRVKIGYTSKSAISRLAELQTGSPVLLCVLWEGDGGIQVEADLHAYFAPLRLHGEWFEFGSRNAVGEVQGAALAALHSPGIVRRAVNARKASEHRQRVQERQRRRHKMWRDGGGIIK